MWDLPRPLRHCSSREWHSSSVLHSSAHAISELSLLVGWFHLLEDVYCLAAFLQFPAPFAFYYSLAPLEAEALKDVEPNLVLMWKTF